MVEGIIVNIFSPSREIVKDKAVLPNFLFDLDALCCDFQFVNGASDKKLVILSMISLN